MPTAPPTTTTKLGQYTPDNRRWRYALAGACAIAAPVLFYYTTRLISSTWSGTIPSLLVLLGSILTLLGAAAVPTILLSPDTTTVGERTNTPVAELKRQYATGDISRAEFEQRLDALVTTPTESDQQLHATDGSKKAERN
jgi:hypothetical protein